MVAVFFADGFEEIEAVTVCDVLKRAGVATVMVGIDSSTVTGAHGIKICTDCRISEIDTDKLEIAVLPGGMPGTANLAKSGMLADILARLKDNGKRIAAICAAPSIPGKLGMLKGVEAVCYPGYEKHLHGALLSGKSTVTDGQITTSKGPGTALAFSLELVRLLRGDAKMAELAKAMLYEGNDENIDNR